MLSLVNVSKSYGGNTLFENANLQVNAGDRVGLVGPNGAGKSTLFRIILRTEESDRGEIAMPRNAELGFLPQETSTDYDGTVVELATSISKDWEELHAFRNAAIESASGPFEDSDAYGEYQERWAALEGATVEAKAKTVLAGLGFLNSDLERPFSALSGGWRMRVHLARLLTGEPDLLMLDEPTNHLDLDSLIWFQNYLSRYPGAILVISHDREFLNSIVTQIAEIRSERLTRYVGDYETYVELRRAGLEQRRVAYENQQREIQRMMQFVERFRAKASKASQAQSMLKKVNRIERLPPPETEGKAITFKFPQPERGGQRTVRLVDIRFAYGEKVVYHGDLELDIERGARIVLVGPNGAGKSTLLKLLASELNPQSGSREYGQNVRVGYFAQHQAEALDSSKTVMQEATDTEQRIEESSVRSLLGSFLFRGDDVFKKVSVLSGGEKSRLALVKLLLDPPNFLLMDEPTTHLDMPSIEALTHALTQFQGSLVFISHDVRFIRSLAQTTIRVDSGKLQSYAGGYDYYLEKSDATGARQGLTAGLSKQVKAAPVKSTLSRKELKRLEAETRQKYAKSKKRKEEDAQRLEKEIETAEARKGELSASFADPVVFENPSKLRSVQMDVGRLEDKLDRLNRDWERASVELEEISSKIAEEIEAIRVKNSVVSGS